jgi:hypothetical protein
MTMLLNLLGKLWAAPVTLVGIVYGLLSSCFGGASISLQHNAICFEGLKTVRPYSAITLGNCILCSTSLTLKIPTYSEKDGLVLGYITVNIGDHEEAHTYQYQKYGIFFPLIWLLKGGPTAKDSLEQDADQYALKLEGQIK